MLIDTISNRYDTRVPWIAAFAIAALVLALRAPDSLTHPQLRAEDGVIFFAQQYGHKLPQFFVSYGGYLNFIPRVVAFCASLFSATFTPAIYNYSALIISAASLASLRELHTGPWAFILMLAPVALAPAGGEVFGTLTNVQWLTQFYLVSVVASTLRNTVPEFDWPRTLATLSAGLTGPFCLFAAAAILAPLMLRSLLHKNRSLLAPLTGHSFLLLCACSCVQLMTIVATRHSDSSPTVREVMLGTSVLAASLQTHILGFTLVHVWTFLALAISVAVVAVWLSRSWVMLAIVLFAALELLSSSMKVGGSPGVTTHLENSDRYFMLAKILWWWCIFMIAANIFRRKTGLGTSLAFGLLCTNAMWMRDYLQRETLQDMHWESYVGQIDGHDGVVVPINPPGWSISLPSTSHHESGNN